MRLPSDPATARSAVLDIYDEVKDAHYGLFDALRVPRATAQRRFADQMGLDFPAVKTVRRFVYIRTRQEVWDDTGRQSYEEAWRFARKIGYYFKTNDYRYDDTMQPAPDPPKLTQPPSEWDPGRYDRSWELLEVDDGTLPGVFTVWYCAEWGVAERLMKGMGKVAVTTIAAGAPANTASTPTQNARLAFAARNPKSFMMITGLV